MVNFNPQTQRNLMITLDHNKLRFSFPEITRELARLANAEADKLTAKFLGENRASAFERLQKENYKFAGLSADYKRSAIETLLGLTPENVLRAVKKFTSGINFDVDSDRHSITTISFQRTLRIPDDGKTYPLPPGLGNFPLVHVDDYSKNVPASWNRRGGVMMPMYQAEALWVYFNGGYPCALKVGAGKINAVTGKVWAEGLRDDPQNYLPLPEQPWLDGYCVEKGFIRQFVAMPLGKGFTAEEQITGEATHGGIQLQLYPLKAMVQFEEEKRRFPQTLSAILPLILPEPPSDRRAATAALSPKACASMPVCASAVHEMGLGAGGKMRQEIYEDERPLEDYDQRVTSRVFVHLCNSKTWRAITGSFPPHRPISAQLYAESNLPWFDYYRDDLEAVSGSKRLAELKTVADLYEDFEETPLPDNESVLFDTVKSQGPDSRPKKVVEWTDTLSEAN
jgi:hypothetical protein